MQKIKFDFEATKQLIYAPNSTAPIGAPVDADGNVANDGTAIGIVLCRRNENNKYWVKQNLVVMVAGYCDIIDAQEIWGDEYSAEAIAAMSDIVFCDDHKIAGGGGGWPSDLPKPSVGGYGYTEQGEQTVITWDGDIGGRYTPGSGFCLVSDALITEEEAIGSVITYSVDDEPHTVTEDYIFPLDDESFAIVDFGIYVIAHDNTTIQSVTFEHKGIYFANYNGEYTSSLTYGTPDTIHKIDEKYLPASGGVTTLHINVSAVDWETFETTFTADKTVYEMENCFTPTWCVVTFAAGTFSDDEEVSVGIPPSWLGGATCFGRIVLPNHNDGGNNEVITAVTRDFDYNWVLDLRAFGT